MLHPEMTRALADQHIGDLHRQAARHLPVAPAAAPLAQHWAVLAMRLHLRRARTDAAPATWGAAPAASTPRNGAATTAAAGARAPMGCIA